MADSVGGAALVFPMVTPGGITIPDRASYDDLLLTLRSAERMLTFGSNAARRVLPGEPCSYPGCNAPATEIAVPNTCSIGPPHRPALKEGPQPYCEQHGNAVVEINKPEYHIHCYNCGCHFAQ